METLLVFFLLFLPIIHAQVIPADKSQLASWFDKTLGAAKPTLQSATASGTGPPKIINVKAGGGGQFKTVTEAVNSIPTGNKQRIIISIGPGNYTEKITIPKDKPFVTLYGDPKAMPVLVYDGTAAKYGTVDSATLTAESDHFMGVNLKVVVSSADSEYILSFFYKQL